ncbi:MAG: hypothetical protein KME13_21470 [Myxacorys californica WJT36-NPBG1]|jgi:hypothetical protein|nr:hypothetical protein [Myxacorys californica WJT36-NPBG1]
MKSILKQNLLSSLCSASLSFAVLVGCAPSNPPTAVTPEATPSQLPPPPPQAAVKAAPNNAAPNNAPAVQVPTSASPDSSPAQASPSTDGNRNRGQITFPAGSTSTSVDGNLASKAIDRYTFVASAGQNGTISVESPNQTVLLTLIDPQGSPIQRYQSGASSWSGKLNDNGTYIIDVVATGDASTYKLNVSIQP